MEKVLTLIAGRLQTLSLIIDGLNDADDGLLIRSKAKLIEEWNEERTQMLRAYNELCSSMTEKERGK